MFWVLPETSETFPDEPFDGLAGRRLVRDWRKKEACHSGCSIVDLMFGRPVGRRQSFGAPAERGPKGPNKRERKNL